MLNKEEFFIKQFHSKYIGDDGAVMSHNNPNLVYSMDAFFEGIHFKREWLNLKQIAIKSMLVNISDALVMGAIPKYALLSISIPKEFCKSDLIELADGFKEVSRKYNLDIIGGDTISNSKLDISVTIISELLDKPLLRTGAKKGFLVAYVDKMGSKLGNSKKDLNRLFRNLPIKKDSKFITPKLKPNFIKDIAKYIATCTDISDGLDIELARFSKANNLGISLCQDISKDIMCSGEEYEPLFSFDKKYLSKIKNIAKKHKIRLNVVGNTSRGRYKSKCKNHHE